MNEIIAEKTDSMVNFCSPCNTQVVLKKFVKVREAEVLNLENKSIGLGLCNVCGKVYLDERYLKVND